MAARYSRQKRGIGEDMKALRMLCSILVVFTTAICMITAAQNLTLRTADVYLFYFNDSGAVDRIYTGLSNSEMADGIADFMNSWRPQEFQIYEDTGYDLQGIFTEEESDSMMLVKKWLDISLALCIVSLIISVAIDIWMVQSDHLKLMRNRTYVTIAFSCILSVGTFAFVSTHNGRLWLAEKIGLVLPEETTTLSILLGDGFISMANTFFIIFAILLLVLIGYILLRLTRPPRIFS